MPNVSGFMLAGCYKVSGQQQLLQQQRRHSSYEGVCTDSGELVSIKVLEKSVSTVRASAAREAEALARLQKRRASCHYRVCDFLESGTKLYLVTGRVEGERCFREVLEGAELGEAEVRSLFAGAVRAVAACHEAGVSHRGVTLDSLMTDPEGTTVWLRDFSRAGTGQKAVWTERLCSPSSPFTPPEILAGKPHSGEMADSWSLGAVLGAMLPVPPSPEARDLLFSLLEPCPEKRLLPSLVLRHPWLAPGINKDDSCSFSSCCSESNSSSE